LHYEETGIKKQPLFKVEIQGLDAFMDKRQLRRVDRFSQMALLASYQALADAGTDLKNTSNTGIVFGSAYGASSATFSFLDSVINDGDKCASPTLFALSVHNSLAAQVSVNMGITGPVQTFSTFGDTVFNVLQLAESWLNNSAADYVLAGFGDEHCAVRTYVAVSCGCDCIPGEGFTVLLLSKDEKTKYGTLNIERSETAEGKRISYEHLFGSFPTNTGMNIAAAAVLPENELMIIEKSNEKIFNLYQVRK
jgi:3-oxoacyl-[acyl-carrier-protein] synthase II